MSFEKIEVLLKDTNDILHVCSIIPFGFNKIQYRKFPDNGVE
jgi:hypothetical protein